MFILMDVIFTLVTSLWYKKSGWFRKTFPTNSPFGDQPEVRNVRFQFFSFQF